MYEHALQAPLRTNHENSWSIRRKIYGQTIVVQADWINGIGTWGMTCKINGQLVDHRQAEEPIEAAINMIEVAINNCEAMFDDTNEAPKDGGLDAGVTSGIIRDAAKRGGNKS